VARLVVVGVGEVEVPPGRTLLEACEVGGIPMETECGGFAACNSCRVRVLVGADALSPVDRRERPFLDRADQRLGCQARLLGDATVAPDPGSA
jgi:adenylate cyclase